MENIKSIEDQIKELEAKKVQLKLEAEYGDKLIHRDNHFKQEKLKIEKSNELLKKYYNELVACGVGNYVKLEEKEGKIEYLKYYIEELKPEDRPEPMEYKYFVIEIDKNLTGHEYIIYNVSNDNKTECYKLVGSYRNVKAKTLADKIKEKILINKEKEAQKIKQNEAKETLIKYFKDKYPTSTIESSSEWISGYNRSGYYINILKISFTNGNYVVIKYYNDASWNIKETYNTNKPTEDEIIDNLSK